jgi:hypothetical protein
MEKYVYPSQAWYYWINRNRATDKGIDDICDRLMMQSEQNLRLQIGVLEGLIHEREDIKSKTLHALDFEQSRINTLILQQQNLGPYLGIDLKTRLDSLEKMVTSIEQDKVREEREAWRDKSRLTQLLIYLQTKYDDARARREAVQNGT